MLALAWLAASRGPGRKKGIGTSDPGMIGYTLPEIRRLLISLARACSPDPESVWSWSWSRWRRRTVIATEHAAYDQVRVGLGDFAVASCPVTWSSALTMSTRQVRSRSTSPTVISALPRP
jgi:hypothetical protein